MSTTVGSDDDLLGPKGLISTNGNYVLDRARIVALLSFVWTGALLPTTKDEYLARTGVTSSHYDHVKQYIDPLLEVFGLCRTHCRTFKSTTYPSIVALRHSVKDFAETAAGTEDGSYYFNIIAAGKTLYTELHKPSAQQVQLTIDEAREIVAQLVDMQVTAIDKLKKDARAAVDDLRTFEEQCQADKLALKSQDKIIVDALAGESGGIGELQKTIEANNIELGKGESQYNQGLVAAPIVMGVHSSKALKMQSTIIGLRRLLDDQDAQIKADKALVADLTLMKTDLQSLIAKIGPAVQAIEGMMGVWDNIALDPQIVKEATQDKSGVGLPPVQRINQKSIFRKWNKFSFSFSLYLEVYYTIYNK
ncbi:hemeolysin E protein [Rutstroemia sp. NJR-2017a BBW]|nr:hemeolysin E protein [Rutstroemia sp. NJR-2017a BBW]